jgi:hypothetical protein
MALETLAEYISDARTLLQDTIPPYRYDDDTLLVAFNGTLLEARRMRPDLFVYRHHEAVPSFTVVDPSVVHMEPPFRLALVYGTVSHALARDQEDVQDARSVMFRQTFHDMLLGMRASATAGSQPVTPKGGRK